MNSKRFNVAEIRAERFIKLPQFLFEGKYKKAVSNDAKVLYALLRNRFELSAKNNWVNSKGEVYIIFTREEMCDMLCCQQEKVRKLVKQLITAGLIEEERMGLNLPNRIFLVHPEESFNNNNPFPSDNNDSHSETYGSTDNSHYENNDTAAPQAEICRKAHTRIVKIRKVKKQHSKNNGISKTQITECRTPSLSKTDFKKTNTLRKIPSILSAEKNELKINKTAQKEGTNETSHTKNYSDELEKTKSQIEYDLLKKQYPSKLPNIVDSITELITDIRTSSDAYITTGSKRRPVDAFCFKLGKLTGLEIEGIIERFKDNLSPINNPRAYLTSMLWNAGSELPLTM